MPNNFQRREIGKGIYLSRITDSKFKLNCIKVYFMAPISEETASENAVAANIITKSCKKYRTFAELNNKLSSLYAARISCGIEKFGDIQGIEISISCIDNKYAFGNEKVNEEATNILLDCLFDPLLENGAFPEKAVELEKQTVIDSIESELNDKQEYAFQKASEAIYIGEPSAVRALGSVQKAKLITSASAYKAYKRMMKHYRIEIICAGCSDFENLGKKIAAAFSEIQRTEIFPCVSNLSPIKNKVKKITEKTDAAQSKLIMGFKSSCRNLPAMDMMNAIYGGTDTSKLFNNVRERLSLCYYCWSSFFRMKGALAVSSGVENENIQKAEDEISAQLDDIKNGNFSDDEVNSAKEYMKSHLKIYNDSLWTISSWYITRIISDDIKSPEDAIEEYTAVTKEDIINAAKSVNLDTIYVLIGDKKSEEETDE